MKVSALKVPGSWLFGTIVALALRESLTKTVPHLVDPQSHLHVAGAFAARATWLETIRFLTFVIVTIRFYLGSVEFFEKAYTNEADSTNHGYATDFSFGLFHFLLFVGWATTADVVIPFKVISPFLILLGIILIFDLPWCLLRRGPNGKMVKQWCLINLLTVILGGLGYTVGLLVDKALSDIWEISVLSFVVVISVVDTWGILMDDPLFPKWFGQVFD